MSLNARSSSSVLVATVSYNSESTLGELLASVADSSKDSLTVSIVDNGSTSTTGIRDLAVKYGSTFTKASINLGYGAGIDAAIDAAPGNFDFVLITNPDVTLTPGSVDTLIAALNTDSRVAAVGPKIITPDGSTYPSARNLPSPIMGIGHVIFHNIWPNNPWSRAYRAERDLSENPRDVGWLSGACLLVRLSAYRAVGGFDHRYFMYFEDVDLGARFTAAGFLNRYEPRAVVKHTGAESTKSESSKMLAVHHDSAYKYLSTRYAKWYQAPLRWLFRIAISTRKALVIRGTK